MNEGVAELFRHVPQVIVEDLDHLVDIEEPEDLRGKLEGTALRPTQNPRMCAAKGLASIVEELGCLQDFMLRILI